MRVASVVAAVVVVVVVVIATSASSTFAQAVSIDDAYKDFAAGKYRPCLQRIARYLANTNLARPGSLERYDLLVLRGECLLNLKEPQLARGAFDSAARSLKVGAKDDKALGVAHATAILIDKSPGMRYKPASPAEGGGGEGIDIVSPDSRPAALQALYRDMQLAAQPQMDEAMKSTNFLSLEKILPTLIDLYAVELAATDIAPGMDGGSKTLATGRKLGDHGRQLADAELVRLSTRIGELTDLANEPASTDGVTRTDQLARRGLTAAEQQELRDVADQLEKISRVCQEGRRMSRRFGATGELWDPFIARAADAEQEARRGFERK